jgi:hypothetical protein
MIKEDGMGGAHIYQTKEMHTGLWWGNFKETYKETLK